MQGKKTKVEDFINYVESYNKLSSNRLSTRLYHVFKMRFHYNNHGYDENDFIEDITDDDFLRWRLVGPKTLAEFKTLKASYFQSVKEKELYCEVESDKNLETCGEESKEKISFWLHSNILKTLKIFKYQSCFVEKAILEKFERDGIVLIK